LTPKFLFYILEEPKNKSRFNHAGERNLRTRGGPSERTIVRMNSGNYGWNKELDRQHYRNEETMTQKTAFKFFAILTLMGILFSTHAFAQVEKLQTTIFPIDGQPIVIQDFNINGEFFYDAVREGKPVKLSFHDLKEIKFLNPGKNYDTEITFNDGRRETYLLQPASDITIASQASLVTLSHSKVARIAFSPIPKQQPPSDTKPIPQTQPDAQPGTVDRVILKSGDSLSGHIQTKTFPVRTAYGTFQLEAPQIAYIEFDAKGPNTAVVLLRNGDRLSGAVEVESVRFVMMSGEGVSFDGKTIKIINFKR